jgi:prepilin-type N-terminal cleavage/methylation domain-containing protein
MYPVSRARPCLATPRRGVSLPELVVALVLFGIVAGAVARALDRASRFHDGIVRLLEARTQLAAADQAVTVALRAMAPAAGDLVAVSDSAVRYRMAVGGGVACAVDSAGITLLPDSIANGQVLVHFWAPPQPGDSAWVFDEGASPAPSDDRWVPARLTSLARVAGGCAGSPVLDPLNDAARPGWRLNVTFGAGVPASVPLVGGATVVCLTRHARFALYRASTGASFLGWADWNDATGRWNVIQPVAGPFVAWNGSQPPASGIAFAARDSAGAAVSAPVTGAAALALTARALTRGAVRLDGAPRGPRTDSLRAVVALRNRP